MRTVVPSAEVNVRCVLRTAGTATAPGAAASSTVAPFS